VIGLGGTGTLEFSHYVQARSELRACTFLLTTGKVPVLRYSFSPISQSVSSFLAFSVS